MMSFLEICDSIFVCNGVNFDCTCHNNSFLYNYSSYSTRAMIVRRAPPEAETSIWYNSTAQLVHFHSAMDSRFVLALILLCSLQVDCQTFPYVSFSMGARLPNHSYVDLGAVGTDYSTSVWCRTDLGTCCRNEDGPHRGQWFFPGGVALETNGDIYGFEKPQRVELRRNNSATSPTGIYRCEIPTNAVRDDTDISVRDTVYVGLYTSGGKFVS